VNSLTDQQLLRDYAEGRSETAFAELAQRHVDFVYSAALRMARDAHLAEDVTQSVFVALSKNARQLTDRPVLSGWLHRTAQNLAANAIRTEVRRRNREQEAVAMNELLANEPDANWKNIAPYLDTALGELSEPDRDALLLRYFECKSAREMAQTLGTSEEAAQKRVNRAVERLREFFSKRNVTVGASGLVVLISTNSVQAAPIGLTAAISTAVSLAGTAISTSTAIVATKTIAMTTLQKTLIASTLAVAVGTGIYQAREASALRTQVQSIQKAQSPFAEKITQLQRERDEATNRLATMTGEIAQRLATMTGEIAQLKSGQNQNELLKLRGQVGTLRQQLVSAEAKANLFSSGLDKMMADPAMKELMIQSGRREIKLRFAELFQELKLSPEQIETFAQTYANNGLGLGDGQGRLTNEEVESRLRSLLGDAGFARYDEFTQEVPARATVRQLNSQLGASQLTAEQGARLLQIVKAEPYDLTYGIEGDLNKAFSGSQNQVDNQVRLVTESNRRIVQQAGAFLTPEQLVALNTVLTNALNTRITQGAALGRQR
jgi:RNA polymerase sigma factor (sigma-70 family)